MDNPEENLEMKKGIFCTEFYIAIIGFIGGLALSVYPESNQMTQLLGAVLAATCGPTYIAGRSWAKGKTGVAMEQGRTIVAASKLQEAIQKKL